MGTKKNDPVTVVITKEFRDKNDHVTWYSKGQEVVFDKDRADDVVKRGLAVLKEVKSDDSKGTEK